MQRHILAFATVLALASSAQAQQPGNDAVLSTYLRRSYAAISKDLAEAVAMMPEEDFGFRPVGAAKEVRTFGEITAHILLVNSWVCSMGEGRTDSTAEPTIDKTRLVALMNVEVTDAEADCPADPKAPGTSSTPPGIGADCQGKAALAISAKSVCP